MQQRRPPYGHSRAAWREAIHHGCVGPMQNLSETPSDVLADAACESYQGIYWSTQVTSENSTWRSACRIRAVQSWMNSLADTPVVLLGSEKTMEKNDGGGGSPDRSLTRLMQVIR